MGVAHDILASWWRPKSVMRKHLFAAPHEGRAFAFLIIACFLIFVSQWPVLRRQAILDPSITFENRVAGALVAWLIWAPIAAYGIAAITRVLARVLGGGGTWYSARLALFWSLLAASPAWLLYGLVAGLIGPSPAQNIVGAGLWLVFLFVWGGSMYAAETQINAQVRANQ